jgi:hypothetical protein
MQGGTVDPDSKLTDYFDPRDLVHLRRAVAPGTATTNGLTVARTR